MKIDKKVVRLTKEQREAKKAKIAEKKAKLKEKRAQKKAARLAKLEAKKQKLAEKRALAKEKREAKKAKELAKRQLMRERKLQKKLDAKLNKKNLKKTVSNDTIKKPLNAKLEAERAEFKALSAIRRYAKDHLKELLSLDDVKRSKKIKKLTKMGYAIVEVDGEIASISYSFTASNKKIKKISKQPKEIVETNNTEDKKEDTDKHMNIDEQPKDSNEPLSLEDFANEIDDTSIDSEDEAAEDTTAIEEVLIGDAYKDETEVAAEIDDHVDCDAEDLEENEDDNEDNEDDDNHDHRFSFYDDISDDQADYRRDAFKEAELNGMYD